MDLILGDPNWLPHPVIGMGKLISAVESFLWNRFDLSEDRESNIKKKKILGTVLVCIVLICSLAFSIAVLLVCYHINNILGIAVEIFMCYQLLASKSLYTESMKVYYALAQADTEEARRAVSMIVGRDTEKLDEAGIARAAIETVAENTSDGVIAPLLFIFLFGAPGGYLYKAVNTCDSMMGYKNDRYIYFGRFAARLDDVVNFFPARISGIAMILASGLIGLDIRGAARIFRRDRYKHASPNSAQTESVCAGALGIRLAGDAWYFGTRYAKEYIGDDARPVEYEDIKRSCRLMFATGMVILVLGICIGFMVAIFIKRI